MDQEFSNEQLSGNNRRLRRHAAAGLQKELSPKNILPLDEFSQHNKRGEYSYFFLNRSGKICDAGFASTRSASPSPRMWKGHFLGDYVPAEKASQFRDFLNDVFESGDKKSCELLFDQTGSKKHLGLKLPLYASVNAVADDTNQYCLLVVEDISARMIAERKKAQTMQRLYHQVIETAIDGFWLADADGYLKEVNAAYAKMSGYSAQELIGMHISQLQVCDQPEDCKAHIDKVIEWGYDRFETKHRRKDGRVIDIEVSATFMPETEEFFVFTHNITRRKLDEQALRIAAASFETQDAILITDAQSNIIRVNRSFTEITGYTADEVIGKNPRIMSSGQQDKAFYAAMWQHLLEHGAWAGEIWDKRKNGDIYPKWMTITAVRNEHGETLQYVAIFSDITVRKQAEEKMRNLALYDPLTGLPNRRLLLDRFHTALSASARNRNYGAVLFLDLDEFKKINDTYGHDCGDLMLIEVAKRIQSCVREVDTVARLGGDEFVVLLEGIDECLENALKKTSMIAEKIREALLAPYCFNHNEHHSSPSIGVSLYCGNDRSVDDLLKYADIAMYQAKDAGRNAVRFFVR